MPDNRRRAPRDPFPSDEEIAERAYELSFLEREADRPSNYLDAAEEELLDRAAKRALLPLRHRPIR
jgi:hypothetical protein